MGDAGGGAGRDPAAARRGRRTPSADVARELLSAAERVLVWDGPGSVRLVAAARLIGPPDAPEAAQQIWSAVHGAVVLELRGLALTPDPATTYEALLMTLIRGLASRPGGQE